MPFRLRKRRNEGPIRRRRTHSIGNGKSSNRVNTRIWAPEKTGGDEVSASTKMCANPLESPGNESADAFVELIRKEGLVVGDGVHGFEQPGDAFAFGHVSAGAGGLCNIHHAGALVHGQKKDVYAREALADFAGGGETVKNGHGDIQNHEIRLELNGLGQSIAPVGGLTTHL